jgi:hypothetical protein
MYQQLWGYKVEEKLYLGLREHKKLNTTGLRDGQQGSITGIFYKIKVKLVKPSHNTPMEEQGERRYSSYSFTTSALDGGEWSASRSGHVIR